MLTEEPLEEDRAKKPTEQSEVGTSDLLSRSLPYAVVAAIVMKHHKEACHIPIEYHHMIEEITQMHMKSLSHALGNLELCYRRTCYNFFGGFFYENDNL